MTSGTPFQGQFSRHSWKDHTEELRKPKPVELSGPFRDPVPIARRDLPTAKYPVRLRVACPALPTAWHDLAV